MPGSELAGIKDKELRAILSRLLERARGQGLDPPGSGGDYPATPGDPRGEGGEIMGERVDIYRYGQVIGRFRCPGYEPYSTRDPVCKFFISSCTHNPGYKSADGILCYPASPRNDETLAMLKGTVGDGAVSE